MAIDTHKPHILVLNSSQEFLQLMQTLLSEEGYRVSTDTKASEKLSEIIETQPDLVIFDFLWVNDAEGWRLLQLMKLEPRTASIPLILCTAGVHEVEALRPRLEAMNVAIVIKPFDLSEILEAVTHQLATRA